MRFLLIVLFLGFGFVVNAQDISFKGVAYEIKKDRIFQSGLDITDALPEEEKQQIRSAFDKKMLKVKEGEEIEKRIKKAEKKQKTAENKQKKAEKELKKSQKAQSNFDKSTKKHKDALNKYEKLKKKGKLSPQNEAKWLEKIDKYKQAALKAKKRL